MAYASVLAIAILAATFHYAYKAAATGRKATHTMHRLALAARAADNGILEREAGSDTALFDSVLLRIFVLPKDRPLVGRDDWTKLILMEDLSLLDARQTAVWAGHSPAGPTHFRIQRTDRQVRPIKAHYAAEPQGSPAVERIVGIYEEVTESLTMAREKA